MVIGANGVSTQCVLSNVGVEQKPERGGAINQIHQMEALLVLDSQRRLKIVIWIFALVNSKLKWNIKYQKLLSGLFGQNDNVISNIFCI